MFKRNERTVRQMFLKPVFHLALSDKQNWIIPVYANKLAGLHMERIHCTAPWLSLI
jgi:hypothetical protein